MTLAFATASRVYTFGTFSMTNAITYRLTIAGTLAITITRRLAHTGTLTMTGTIAF
jgi:hypothetical protein